MTSKSVLLAFCRAAPVYAGLVIILWGTSIEAESLVSSAKALVVYLVLAFIGEKLLNITSIKSQFIAFVFMAMFLSFGGHLL